MKKIIATFLITVFLFLSAGNYRTLKADETTNILLYYMALLSEKRNMIMDYAEELKEKYDWLETINTVNQLDELLDLTVCSEESFYLYGALRNDMACFDMIEFETVLFDYSASLDWLYLALSSLSMESGERIQTLNQAIDYVKKMQREMNQYNRQAKGAIEAQMMEEAINSQSGAAWSINRY